ncbi:hypothetical protein AAMO2058_001166700 [Amorphochlora amoebiformis]|uniref:Uncharacterized protein n=1 Tax=Amorphochlora amoebiformis TaxID=1561963 RepID=A0A7S0DAP4_9EUKA
MSAQPPGGPAPARREEKSWLSAGLKMMKTVSSQVQKGVQDAAKQIQKDFDDVQVQCPTCGAVFRWPKGQPKAAACGQCGTLVEPPKAKDKANFHFQTMMSAINKTVEDTTGKSIMSKTKQWNVVVPQGAVPGQQIDVYIENNQYRTVVPQGARPGDTFPIVVDKAPKIIATKGKKFPITGGNLIQVVPDQKSGGVPPPQPPASPSEVDALPILQGEVVEAEGVVVATAEPPTVEGKVC